MHGAVGEHEHDVGAAGAAIAPAFQLDGGEIGHEIRLPHMVARPHGDEVAIAGEVFALAGALGKIEGVAEDEGLVVEDVHHHRQVGGADQERALGAAAVEVPMLGVERDGEQALLAPFKRTAAAVGEFELRRAVAFKNVDDFFVEVPLRRGRFAAGDLEHEHIGEVAAARQMHRGAVDAVARPWRRCDVEQIDAVILGDGIPSPASQSR